MPSDAGAPPSGLVLIDGRPCAPQDATVSIYDRGFLYGDSIFEVIRTYGGRPFGLDEHVERLRRSAEKIGLSLPWPVAAMVDEVTNGLALARQHAVETGQPPLDEAYLRLIVTRGRGSLGLDPALADAPMRVVMIHPLVLPPPKVYREGIELWVVDSMRATDGTAAEGAKSSNYLSNLLALREAKAHGAYEPLFVRRHPKRDPASAPWTEVLEGGTSNVFALFGRTLLTPPERRILSGVTRRYVLESAPSAGYEPREEVLTLDRLVSADEVFITSTVRELVPVVRVSSPERAMRIGDGKVGPAVKLLHMAFRRFAGAPTAPMPWD
ncbi:MAG: branched-chain-amino-acid transaminase [Polyangiales bacterium]